MCAQLKRLSVLWSAYQANAISQDLGITATINHPCRKDHINEFCNKANSAEKFYQGPLSNRYRLSMHACMVPVLQYQVCQLEKVQRSPI